MSKAEREPMGEESDADLLKGAFSDEPEKAPEKEPEKEPEPEKPEERPRDETGKFKAKEEKPEEPEPEKAEEPPEPDKAAEQPADDKRDHIPAWRLREEAEAKRAEKERADKLDRELQDMRRTMQQFQQHNQPKQEPIDPFENPTEWHKQQQETLQQTLLNERLNMSESMARFHFGDEVVDGALQWAKTLPPHETQAILQSRNPYGDLVKRKKQADTLAEIGTDPNAWKEKYKADLMKDPEFVKAVLAGAKTEAASRPESNITKLPPSLNRQPSAANAKADAGDPNDMPMSDSELLSDALRR